MTEGDGKGANLCLSDLMDLKKTVSAMVKEATTNPLHEQFVYSLEKINEAIDYIKNAIKIYGSGEIPQQVDAIPVVNKIKKTDTKIISGTDGLKFFLGVEEVLPFR